MISSQSTSDITIVGIGASAGGLEAFEQFFRHTPANTGMAFVLVPHLDPSHSSLLTEILQRTTAMPVVEAQDQLSVEANKVYVIPPNRDMAIFHGTLQLTLPEQPRGQRMPIDAFFRSLAEDCQEKAIGIILSGTGSDGTLGLRAIIGAGGFTLVQKPNTAKYDGMPISAIHAGYVTQVLPVEKMPEALLTARNFAVHTKAPVAPKSGKGLINILMQLRTATGHDFTLYKKSTVNRRIERRMLQHNIEDTDVYVHYLKENPAEVRLLFKELLINVTSFFRDSEAFTLLQKEILPSKCADKPDNYVFRVWIAGCATGEEAYSIAILLRELLDETHQSIKVQIYSTDLDEEAINTARAGIYPVNIAQDVTPERLRRFFSKEDAGYRIKKEIREMVVFAIQNIIKDPPFTKLDMLSCRNLMIYLEPELQNRLIPMFHYALKPDGLLFLSPSESVGNHTDLFSPLNRKWKMYSATHAISSRNAVIAQSLISEKANDQKQPALKAPSKEVNLAEFTRRMLLKYFAPAAVITDFKGDVLYVYGETGKYLRLAQGHANFNVIEMAGEGMELELRSAIQRGSMNMPTLNRELPIRINGELTQVSLSVIPLASQNEFQNLLLISFKDLPEKPVRKRVKPSERSHIEELVREVSYLKESYQASIEEQQATNEELKSANEEMQSTNEELQSTNEEMETSKEELQSVNEELITVNSELQAKIEQLTGVQNDMKNLLDNINVGIIFLDRNLMIRSFTREAARVYRLVPADIGRPITDLRSALDEDDLIPAAATVLESLTPYEREFPKADGSWILARIQPYKTLDNIIDGVVLTFTDITARIRAIAAEEALALAQGIVDTVREPLLVLDGKLKIISASRSFYREFQVTPEQTVGHQLVELGAGQWDIPELHDLLKTIVLHNESIEKFVAELDFPVIGHRKIQLNARCIASKVREPQLILLSIEIIS